MQSNNSMKSIVIRDVTCITQNLLKFDSNVNSIAFDLHFMSAAATFRCATYIGLSKIGKKWEVPASGSITIC